MEEFKQIIHLMSCTLGHSPWVTRKQVIHLSGYTLEEKVHIATKHLLPCLMTEHGLSPTQLRLSEAVMTYIVDK